MFYNELLIKGVDLLKPLPWHLSHLCSGGVPESAGHTQRLEQTHALVQGVKFAVDTYHFNSGSLSIHSESLGREVNQQPVATRTLQNQSEVRVCQLLASSCPGSLTRIFKVLWLLYMGEELKIQLLPIISMDLWIWLYLANSTDVHYQLPTFLFLQTFIKTFFEETRSCPQEVRSYGLHLC